jgi:hypothetical protein
MAVLEPEMEAARRAYAGSKPYDAELQAEADNDRALMADEFHRNELLADEYGL